MGRGFTIRMWEGELVIGYSTIWSLFRSLFPALRELLKIGNRTGTVPRVRMIQIARDYRG